MKVATFVGTRPEIIRLSRIICILDKHVEHTLVHTGQNYDYELNEIFFKDLEIRRPDYFLDAAGSRPMETIAKIIDKADLVLEELKPDALLILGDTNSALVAIPAKRRKIPIFHMEAGNRCFDMRVPEEVNRRIVDHISDINLPYTTIARQYLINEGLKPEQIIKTGSPMKEVLDYYHSKISRSTILEKLGLEVGKYFVVSAHREENVDSPERLKTLMDILQEIQKKYEFRVIFSIHPRTRKRLEGFGLLRSIQGVELIAPLGFSDYIKLQTNAALTISDSGTITEESSILGFKAITIRDTHERPEGMEEGAIIMTGLNKQRVIEAMDLLLDHSVNQLPINTVADYLTNNVSVKVLRIILSYTDYVNRYVWRKN